MDYPWKEMLGGATGGAVVLIVAALFLGKTLTEKVIEAVLKRAEEHEKSALAFTSTVDTDLRKRRIRVYAELWDKTGTLPRWPRNPELKYADLRNLTQDFRDWYFKKGGMYLSGDARKAYGDLQEHITSVLEGKSEGLVKDADYKSIQEKCSALRTELTKDVLSRLQAPKVSTRAQS
jgi:hypothetical protein